MGFVWLSEKYDGTLFLLRKLNLEHLSFPKDGNPMEAGSPEGEPLCYVMGFVCLSAKYVSTLFLPQKAKIRTLGFPMEAGSPEREPGPPWC